MSMLEQVRAVSGVDVVAPAQWYFTSCDRAFDLNREFAERWSGSVLRATDVVARQVEEFEYTFAHEAEAFVAGATADDTPPDAYRTRDPSVEI